MRFGCVLIAFSALGSNAQQIAGFEVDPFSRNVNVVYSVPANAPDPVTAVCTWSPPGKNEWRPADVMPLVSETAYNMAPAEQSNEGHFAGAIVERRAAGLNRTAVFNPYPAAEVDGQVHVDFRVELRGHNDVPFGAAQARIDADNKRAVSKLVRWSRAIWRREGKPWSYRTDSTSSMTLNNALFGNLGLGRSSALTYTDLKGTYAIYLHEPSMVAIRHASPATSARPVGLAVSARKCCGVGRMDQQHLVLRQTTTHGWRPRYRLHQTVPLTDAQVRNWTRSSAGHRSPHRGVLGAVFVGVLR